MTFLRRILCLCLLSLVIAGGGCGPDSTPDMSGRSLHLSSGAVKTLDPALASDLASRDMVSAFYDRLLEYDYVSRPYKLAPSMLTNMPEVSKNGKVYTFTLRDDLYFRNDPCFEGKGKAARKVTSHDVVFSFLRIADGRVYSPVFWMFRGKIVGINSFTTKLFQLVR